MTCGGEDIFVPELLIGPVADGQSLLVVMAVIFRVCTEAQHPSAVNCSNDQSVRLQMSDITESNGCGSGLNRIDLKLIKPLNNENDLS